MPESRDMTLSTHVASTQMPRPPKAKQNTTRRDLAKAQIMHYIRLHQIKPGEKLPTVRALSDHIELTRDATWRALRELQNDGWIRDLPQRRFTVADEVYSEILRTLRVRAVFCGHKYIFFTGFRRLADSLTLECLSHGLDLSTTLVGLNETPPDSIWDDCDVLLVDSETSGTLLQQARRFPIPVLGLDANYSDRYHTNIVTDHQMGGRLAAERLIKKGSRKVCVPYFRGSEENPRIKARIEGFRQAWIEAGRGEANLTIAPIEWSSSSFELALKAHEYLKQIPHTSDFFATDGHLAIAFLEVLVYMGATIPERVRLIGYDGAQMGEVTDPPMTTIQQDMDSLAEAVIQRVADLAQLGEKMGEVVRIPPLLVKRTSA